MAYEDLLRSSRKNRYMMLSRLQLDCEYYLGHGKRGTNALWTQDEEKQIALMKNLWISFSDAEKPEWISWEDILEFETAMCR